MQKERLSVYLSKWIKTQLQKWQEMGILDARQIEAISNLYVWPKGSIVSNVSHLKRIRYITSLLVIGSFLVGLGVISFVAFNWAKIGYIVKLSLLMASFIIAHLTGVYLFLNKPNLKRIGLSLIFLGNLLFGANIWLVAQMYHINYGFTTGIFLWAIGVVPTVYFTRSRLNYFLSVGLFLLWALSVLAITHQMPILYLFVLLGILIPLSYYIQIRSGLITCITTGGVWLLLNNFFWLEGQISLYLFLPIILYGIFLLVLSNLYPFHLLHSKYRQIYIYAGVIICTVSLILVCHIGASEYYRLFKVQHIFPISFWICNIFLLLCCVIINQFVNDRYLDSKGILIRKLVPPLLVTAYYVFAIPYIKPYMVLLLFPIAFIAYAHWHYSRTTLFLNIFLIYLPFWLYLYLKQWHQLVDLLLLYLFYGHICYLLGWVYITKHKLKIWGEFFKFLGLLWTCFILYIFGFESLSTFLAKWYRFQFSYEYWLFFLLFYLTIVFLFEKVFRLRYPENKDGLFFEERILLPVLYAVPLILLVSFSYKIVNPGFILLFNILYLVLIIGLIMIGYHRNQPYLKLLSFIFLILLVMTRYIEADLSFKYKTILFISTGIVIIALGVILERYKDRMKLFSY